MLRLVCHQDHINSVLRIFLFIKLYSIMHFDINSLFILFVEFNGRQVSNVGNTNFDLQLELCSFSKAFQY